MLKHITANNSGLILLTALFFSTILSTIEVQAGMMYTFNPNGTMNEDKIEDEEIENIFAENSEEAHVKSNFSGRIEGTGAFPISQNEENYNFFAHIDGGKKKIYIKGNDQINFFNQDHRNYINYAVSMIPNNSPNSSWWHTVVSYLHDTNTKSRSNAVIISPFITHNDKANTKVAADDSSASAQSRDSEYTQQSEGDSQFKISNLDLVRNSNNNSQSSDNDNQTNWFTTNSQEESSNNSTISDDTSVTIISQNGNSETTLSSLMKDHKTISLNLNGGISSTNIDDPNNSMNQKDQRNEKTDNSVNPTLSEEKPAKITNNTKGDKPKTNKNITNARKISTDRILALDNILYKEEKQTTKAIGYMNMYNNALNQ